MFLINLASDQNLRDTLKTGTNDNKREEGWKERGKERRERKDKKE